MQVARRVVVDDEEDRNDELAGYRPSRPTKLNRAAPKPKPLPKFVKPSSDSSKRPHRDVVSDISAERAEQERVKRLRTAAKENLVKTLTCPLTLALFIDPVQMSDGHTYEALAAEVYIATKQGSILSPLTKKPLKNLLMTPNHAVRNAVVHAIESKDLEGELVDEWLATHAKRKRDAEYLEKLHTSAFVNKDPEALKDLGVANMLGWYGLAKDEIRACVLFKSALDLKNVTAMALYGHLVMKGVLVISNNTVVGMTFIGMAAGLGSEFACFLLAGAFENGDNGFSRNATDAKKWYEEMAKCEYQDADPQARAARDKYLAPPAAVAASEASDDETIHDDDDNFNADFTEGSDDDDEEGEHFVDTLAVRIDSS